MASLAGNAFLFFLLLISAGVEAQPEAYDIEISFSALTIRNNKLNIHIFKNTETITIVYSTQEKYYVFTKDSISISDKQYADLLDSIYITDQQSLIRVKRSIFDGVGVKIVQKTNNSIDKVIQVLSPTKTSHPEIYRLITYTLNLYRERNPDSLDKSVTFGY